MPLCYAQPGLNTSNSPQNQHQLNQKMGAKLFRRILRILYNEVVLNFKGGLRNGIYF